MVIGCTLLMARGPGGVTMLAESSPASLATDSGHWTGCWIKLTAVGLGLDGIAFFITTLATLKLMNSTRGDQIIHPRAKRPDFGCDCRREAAHIVEASY